MNDIDLTGNKESFVDNIVISNEYMSVKQIAEALRVSETTVKEAVSSLTLKCQRKGRSHAYCFTKEQSLQIMNYINTNKRVSNTCNEVALRTNKEQLNQYVASNETLTQVVSMLAENQRKSDERFEKMFLALQQSQSDNMKMLERILCVKEEDVVKKTVDIPLSEMWYSSAAILSSYKEKLNSMGYTTTRAVTTYLKSELHGNKNFVRLSKKPDKTGFHYTEFRADFVEKKLNE